MNELEQPLFVEMTQRYTEQQLPWNVELPPPEVLAIVNALPAGRALDLGCGFGRASLYLARHGWQCDGVDFVEQAVVTARQRAEAAGLAEQVAFHLASVAEIDFLQPPYDLVIDVGCLHAQSQAVRIAYARQVERLLRPGGLFLLFAHVRDEAQGPTDRWIPAAQIDALFQAGFVIERVERGSTTVGDSTWPSAWYWLRRNSALAGPVAPPTLDWQSWLQRWDVQQTGYLPDREERFNAMFHVLQTLLPPDFVALDLACGPGSLSQRLLARFPQARSVAVDLDPVLLTLGQNALGDLNGRLRWVEADLAQRDWVDKVGDGQFDAVVSTTALHWLQAGHLVQLFNMLAKIIRPGGVFLNGDNIPFGPQFPTFDQVAKSVDQAQQADAFTQRGVENWENWWEAIAKEPGMEPLLAERKRRFTPTNHNPDDSHNPITDFYQAALRNAGFREVGVIWRNLDNQIIMAVR